MKPYRISKICGAPEWDRLPCLALEHYHWLPAADIRAEAAVCYDDTGIYVRMKAWEDPIRALETGPLGKPYEDSCLEFFFQPVKEDKRYFNIEINPNGCAFIGIGNPESGIIRLLPYTLSFSPEISFFPGGWAVSYQIPLSFLQLFFPEYHPVSGGKLWGNFYKCGDKTQTPHYIAAFPIHLSEPNFHRPDFFGEMEFE